MPKLSQYRYDYYHVNVPSDLGDEEQRIDCAINQAREQTRLYVVPCDWTVTAIDGETYTVRRRRNR